MFFIPAVVPVTLTEKLQDAPAARAAPESDTVPDPAVAVIAPPPQVPVRPLGVDMVSPAGSGSVKPTPISVDTPWLVIVKLKLVAPFSGIVADPNDFAIMGTDGGGVMDSVAVVVLPTPPFWEVTVALFCAIDGNALLSVTFKVTVQNAPAAKVAPESDTAPDPAVAPVTAPPQLFTTPGIVATTIPAGSVSVKPTPIRVAVVFVFVI